MKCKRRWRLKRIRRRRGEGREKRERREGVGGRGGRISTRRIKKINKRRRKRKIGQRKRIGEKKDEKKGEGTEEEYEKIRECRNLKRDEKEALEEQR